MGAASEPGVTQHRYSRWFFVGPVIEALTGVFFIWAALGSDLFSFSEDFRASIMALTGGAFAFLFAAVGIRQAVSVYETGPAGIRKAGPKHSWTAWNQIESVTLHEESATNIILHLLSPKTVNRRFMAFGASDKTSETAREKITPGVKHRRFVRGPTWFFGNKYLYLRLELPGKKILIMKSQLSGFDGILACTAEAAARVSADESTRHNFQHLGLLPGGAADEISGNAAPPPD